MRRPTAPQECARTAWSPSGRAFAALVLAKGARGSEGFFSADNDGDTGPARTIAIIMPAMRIVINDSGGWPRCAVSTPMPDPGASRANCYALVPAAFATVNAVFDAVERSAVISFIASAFSPVEVIFNKIRAAPRIETPFACIGRLRGADAAYPKYGCSGGKYMIDTHTVLSLLENAAAGSVQTIPPQDAAPDAAHKTLEDAKIRRRHHRKIFDGKTGAMR